MPTYRITAPDGTVYRVNGEGTEQEALAALQAQISPKQPAGPDAFDKSIMGDAKNYGPMDAALIGAGKATSDLWEGAKQLVGMGRPEAERQEAERLYAPLKAASPFSTAIGESAPYMLAGGAAGSGAKLAGTMMRQGLAGAGVGAMKEGTAEQRGRTSLEDLAMGLGGGALAHIPLAMSARAMRPEVQMMREAGVVPTVGQTLGGVASKMEERLGSLPGFGDLIGFARSRARDEMNVGGLNRALAPIGGSVTESGQAGVGQAQKLGNEAYDAMRALAPGGIVMDQQARGEIANLKGLLRNAPDTDEKAFNRFYKGVYQKKLGGANGFEVNNFGELDSLLGDEIRTAGSIKLKDAYKEMQRIIRDQASRANPEYAAAKTKADTSYAMMKRIEDATNRAAVKEGKWSPGQLVMSARKLDKSVDKRAAARGDALMQDYGTAAQNVLGDVIPDSGTAPRILAAAGLSAGTMLDPTVLASALAALAGASRPAQAGMNATLRGMRFTPAGLAQLGQGNQ